MTTTPPDWYDDGAGRLRWWDGQAWTSTYAPAAEPAAPVAPAAAPVETVAPAATTTQAPRRTGALGQVRTVALVAVNIMVATVTSAPRTPSPYAHDTAADTAADAAAAPEAPADPTAPPPYGS